MTPSSLGFNKRDLKSAGATLGPRNVITRDKDEMKMKEKYRVHEKFLPVDIKRTADTWLIVAALIATVTFAAGFTVPGGYDGNGGPDQGMAVLTRKAAFKAFVICDTIAMMFSACAVFIHFIAADDANKHKLIKHYTSAYCLTIIAMGAMMVAFMTGLYTVLAHSPGLAISLCIISCSSFPIYYLLLKKAWRDSKTS
ncbi:hypothetical protein F0562_035423 [Nyssa sinensis]|uniref:PGG domain-containing protein n=1 Tax=Nyssa sinensis TaxID=561372 RepID=A0A5J5ABN6_9ASTE|nr:hypothetical protein F0562_035423 [Nyssa sinensis]